MFSKYIFDYLIENMPIPAVYSDKNKLFNWPVEDAGFGIMMYRSNFRDNIGLFSRCEPFTKGKGFLRYRQLCKNDSFSEKLGGVLVEEGDCMGSFQRIVFGPQLSTRMIWDCYEILK